MMALFESRLSEWMYQIDSTCIQSNDQYGTHNSGKWKIFRTELFKMSILLFDLEDHDLLLETSQQMQLL